MSQLWPAAPSALRSRFALTRPVYALVWAAWGAGAALALGLFVLGLPLRSQQLAVLAAHAAPMLCGGARGLLSAPLCATLSANVYPVLVLAEETLLVGALTLVGLLLFWRQPRHCPTVLFSLAMISYGPYITGSLTVLLGHHPGWQMPIRAAQTLGIGSAVISGYLFPDGRFVPQWTRALILLWLPCLLAGLTLPGSPLDFTNPYAPDAPRVLLLIAWLATTLLAQASRYRQAASQLQRLQTRWVLICMTTTIVTYCLYMAPHLVAPVLNRPGAPGLLYTAIGYPVFLCSLPVSPVIIFVAIWRHHLFDIDTLVNRALVYGSLTFILAVVYAGSVALLGYALRGLTGGSQLALVGSTLATAALVQPLRGRIQQSIDRRFFRRKYDAAKTLSAFSGTLRQQVDLQEICERMLTLVEETTQPERVSLWLTPPEWREQRRHIHGDRSENASHSSKSLPD